MEEIEIQKTINGIGFIAKPEVKILEAVKFSNGKIAYLDGQTVRSLDSESAFEEYPNLVVVKKTKKHKQK